MSWIAKLADTYDQSLELDVAQEEKPIPISHTVQNAHINVVINDRGDFLRAKVLEGTQIVLPATESSAGRSSGEAPHPLADKLQYVAADYAKHGGKKNSYFKSYVEQLTRWSNSEFCPPSVVAVLTYVSKESVIADLVREKIVWTDTDGVLLTSWPEDNGEPPALFKVLPKEKKVLDQGNALVCWTVERPGALDTDTWVNVNIQQAWIAYENSKTTLSGLCYVSGDKQPIALNHPAKLRHSGDKAKIISSNDLTGFTFKGRFTDTKTLVKQGGLQGATIGGRTSQKAHNALRWLIKRQGFRNGEQAIVAWAVSGAEIPAPLVETIKYNWDDLSEATDQPTTNEAGREPDYTRDLGQSYARNLNRYMAGYRAKLAQSDTISIIAIDSATPGRMGITYYRECLPQEYLDRISKWHTDFAWFQRVSREILQPKGKPKTVITWPVSTPSPYSIMRAVYGDILKSNASLKKNFFERLIPSIIEGTPVPQDLVHSAYNRARHPAGKEKWEWEKCLGIACSLYRGFHLRHRQHSERKEYAVSLDTSIQSRDYLYGRLLAIAERMEEVALSAAQVNRPTNASRLMQRFSDRPYSTWPIIYKQLDPYIRQLKTSRPGFLFNMMKELDEVMNLFDTDDFKRDTSLAGEFLLGFHAERLALRTKRQTSDEDPTEPTEE